ncbi:unnamed protein product [Effrenium voratum]|uniref:DRBM domain-containing protein n=1 Tax=Effrenium voratum TaxID=2562239 RepID=A0AA36NI84_9DINO|nr:unnamed protein product [Effrenium voratum]CAJ1403268.1 unnamed protein product [Effrenium voratum]CAJ1444588.1 unnamed protein product [Effrenium voratum]|mmetsp:Transcript_19907/g.47001  ORF Transcript_19907/g.47001 Transcript_19907/m.47001 type:complete len:364 (+) Transcript_19907:21-1112(+)
MAGKPPDLAEGRFLWACPHGSSTTCNSKRWKLPKDPGPESISTLNEWCQAMSPHLSLHWDFSFLDASQAGKARLGRADAGRLDLSYSSGNFKGQLNNLLHKLLRRPVVKGDVVYEVESENAPFTASVSLTPDALWASLGGQRRPFVGNTCSAKKSAEQSAAAKALEALQELLSIRNLPIKTAPVQHGQIASANYKGQLVEQLQQLLGHTLMPGDVLFKTQAELPPFVCSVEVNALQEKVVLLGSACPTKKTAEQSAAQAMVDKLHRDHPQKLKKKPVPGPMAPIFCCTVAVMLGEAAIASASDRRGFCSKQAAKESAAFAACEVLSQKVAGAEGQLQLSEQLRRFEGRVQPSSGVPRPVGLVT